MPTPSRRHVARLARLARAARLLPLAIVAHALVACAPPEEAAPPKRDWAQHPAIVEVPAVPVLYALSDIHGGYERAVAILHKNGILEGIPSAPADARWAAGDATLVVIGDMFDKGPRGLDVIDLFQRLAPLATDAGGRVLVLMGNHEAEFLADPENDRANKADGIAEEIRRRGLRPYDIASPNNPRGRFLRELPFAARVGGWFFLHAGDSRGRSLPEMESILERALDVDGYSASEIVGADSVLESIGWFRASDSIGQQYAEALGVRHIVFGHDPSGIGSSRSTIGVDAGGVLFRIDCGLSPNIDYSDGKLLRVRRQGDLEIAESLGSDGIATILWSGAL